MDDGIIDRSGARAVQIAERRASPKPVDSGTPDSCLVLSSDVTIAAVPALVGDRIEKVLSVLHPAEPRPITWLGGFPLAQFLEPLRSSQHASAVLSHQ
jgi:hypothetical protein